jgi:hypothetical protein
MQNIKRCDPEVFIEENLVKIENNSDFSYRYIKSVFFIPNKKCSMGECAIVPLKVRWSSRFICLHIVGRTRFYWTWCFTLSNVMESLIAFGIPIG